MIEFDHWTASKRNKFSYHIHLFIISWFYLFVEYSRVVNYSILSNQEWNKITRWCSISNWQFNKKCFFFFSLQQIGDYFDYFLCQETCILAKSFASRWLTKLSRKRTFEKTWNIGYSINQSSNIHNIVIDIKTLEKQAYRGESAIQNQRTTNIPSFLLRFRWELCENHFINFAIWIWFIAAIIFVFT